ncbi:MAG TPA: tryptophan--tRNA ligase [Candidatus Dormibacteraeota bacterium]|nr:tryptophan--tRNA ligase [Candidatus Dormibacteraeota bacterium]
MTPESPVPAGRRPRVFSGIQPTGVKHLGNYSGGFRQYAQAEAEGDAIICIVDLHSISVAYDPADLRAATLDLAALLFTFLDPQRSTIFVQSHVSAHAEGAWLLGAAAAFGELRRMTQFKDKAEQQDHVSVDLFTYPVLMAADILLHQTDVVPVGDDQRQHLELTRDVAARFNARFGDVLRVPEGRFPSVGARIMDLQDPARKMSTSSGADMGRILILDPPDTIRRKIRSAVTDTGTEVRRRDDKPGIGNLVEIMSVATGRPAEDIEAEFDGGGYGRFKAAVADATVALLEPIRERALELRTDPAELERLLASGAERARESAEGTLRAMYDAMGFVAPRRAHAIGT